MEYSHSLWVIHLLRITDGLENVFLCFLWLPHRHIDTRQGIVTRRDIVGIATLQVEFVTLLGILRRRSEIALTNVDHRQQIQQVTPNLGIVFCRRLWQSPKGNGLRSIVLLGIIQAVGLVTQGTHRLRLCRREKAHGQNEGQQQLHSFCSTSISVKVSMMSPTWISLKLTSEIPHSRPVATSLASSL